MAIILKMPILALYWAFLGPFVRPKYIINDSPNEKVETMIFEEHVVTHEKWFRSYSWQMTLRLGLSDPLKSST